MWRANIGWLVVLGLGAISLCILIAVTVRPKLDKRLWLPVVGVLAALAVLLSTGLRQGQESGRRCSCMSNVRFLGLAATQYAEEHGGRYPNDLVVLLQEGYLPALYSFICPSSGKRPRDELWDRDPKTITSEELAEFNCYVLVPGARPTWPGNLIIIHEKDNHWGAGRNCWFNDGHVKWLTEDEFQRRMREQEAKLRELQGKGSE